MVHPRLAYVAVPRFVRFVDELPTTANGKVRKQELVRRVRRSTGDLGADPAARDRQGIRSGVVGRPAGEGATPDQRAAGVVILAGRVSRCRSVPVVGVAGSVGGVMVVLLLCAVRCV